MQARNAVLWFATAVACLPLLIAIFRKLQALGMLVAEVRVTRARAGARTEAIRAVVAQSIVIAGSVVIILYLFVLSSTLLGSVKVFMVLLPVLGVVAFLLWRAFIRIYSRGQIALRETLSQPPLPHEAATPLPGLLSEADLETLEISSGSPAAGKLILELALRSRTGASIVGIQRAAGERIINPGPDEDLRVGDTVLLLGTRAQLDASKASLSVKA
jgi:CPA2 family monovalent cation:H+ antiporter-2